VTGSSSLLQETAEVCAPIIRDGKRYRGLNALAQKDHALLRALSRGEFALSGIRNADLRALLYLPPHTKTTKAEIRRRSAAVTRQFALLRAHGLLRKLPRTHRYQITAKGRRIITALLAACYADVEQLTKMAA
jgi:DNA-binding MarR family transcriptional regulator